MMPLPAIQELCQNHSALKLLVLFGSQSRGDTHGKSDWDFGYLASREFDEAAFLGQLVAQLGTENVDLVDLERASGLLRFRVSQEGKPVYQRAPGEFENFCIRSARFWYDAYPIVREAQEQVLAQVRP